MNNNFNEDEEKNNIEEINIDIPIIEDIEEEENEEENFVESEPIEEIKEKVEVKTKKFSFANEVYEWLEAVALSVVIVVLIFTFILRIVGVDGSSMEDTLHGGEKNPDKMIISNLFYKPAVKDIIVFLPKGEIENNKPYVKRIIATEGQTVNIDVINHKVFVDGVELNEPYIKELVNTPGDQKYPLLVPPGHIFVMGDNRNNSLDSRYTQVGTVDIRFIIGRVIFRIFPLDKMGSVDK